MPLVYLRESTAILEVEPGDTKPIASIIGSDAVMYERDAVLVYPGVFKTMTGEVVTVTPADIDRLCGDRQDVYTKLLAGGDVTYDQLAPIQTDHSRSSWDTVGRVMRTFKGIYKGQKALYGRLRFLGEDAVSRAKDGRWTHLSVAANFETGFLKELTVTPFPAAGGAILLSEGDPMNPKLVAYLMKAKNLSEADATKALTEMTEECRNDLVKLSEGTDPGTGDGPRPLGDAVTPPPAAEVTPAAVATPPAKELGGADDPAVKKFAAARGKISELARNLRRGSKDLGRDVRVAQLSERFSALRSEGKISPAEVKKVDVVKLSEASPEAQELVLKSYADRQPVIFMGQYGTTVAPSATTALRKTVDDKMLAEMAQDMKFSSSAVKHLAEEAAPSAPGTNGSMNLTDSGVPQASAMNHFKHLSKLMEEGKHDECKSYLMKCLSEDGGAVAPSVDPESEKRMSAVAENFKKLQNQVDDLVKVFAEAAGLEESELA